MLYYSSGDAPFFFVEQLVSISWLPQVWNSAKDFGENLLPRLWIDYPFRLIVKLLASFGLGWGMIEKLLWILALVIGVVSIYKLAKFVIGRRAAYISILLYITNTYALFLFGGGQLGVALAYGLAPLVLLKFIQNEKKTTRNGLWLALLVVFDLRLAYLVLGAIFLYQIISKAFHIRSLSISILVVVAVHAFWILPTILTRVSSDALGSDLTNPGMLQFLSFADFSHSIVLLHPNWPENLFGKVYFLQPEFLFLPLVAFSALFITSKRRIMSYFALLVILGAFFAKGAQPPFGALFIWCFQHIPGFMMFRDPTKFYLFIAIGYAILIPFVFEVLGKNQKKVKWIVYGVFVLFWCFTIRPLFLGQLTGNFKPQAIPTEYLQLKNMLVADAIPSRTLWIPSKEKFVYSSNVHPALVSSALFNNASLSGVMTIATSSSFLTTISEAGVRYVIVPKDIERTMYMTEYVFDAALRERMIQTIDHASLVPLSEYKEIAVFENPSFTTMKSSVPDIALKQQKLANIGLMISGVSLVIFCVILICL